MISLVEIFSTFIVMFAIIDITGSIPIFVSMREQGKTIRPLQAAVVALALFVAFFFAGDALLHLFSIDTASFAASRSTTSANRHSTPWSSSSTSCGASSHATTTHTATLRCS